MAQGWIAVHRQLQQHWLWEDKPFSKGQAWIDLLLLANHCDNKFLLGNELMQVNAGDVVTSIAKLCVRWGWSNTKVVSFLNLLESDGMISKKSDTKKTVITIENYSKYSVYEKAETMRKRCENDAKTMRKHTINNDNNVNNSNNNMGRFTPPTVDEVSEYCQERKNSINPESFVDYYASKGWMIGKNKMKDWKAAVRNWERRQKKQDPATSQDMNDLDDVF